METRQHTDKMAAWTVVAVGIFAIGFFVIQSTGLVTLDEKNGALSANLNGSSVKQLETPSIDPYLDTDGDKITDVDEINIGTDPKKADTDNDGYSDKQEIDTGHDPLVNAKKASEVAAKSNVSPVIKVSDGSTVALPSSQQTASSSDPAAVLDSLKSAESLGNLALLNTTINNGNAILPEISDKEIIVSQNDGRSAIQNYLASLMGIFIKDSPWSGKEEFEAAFNAVRMGSVGQLNKTLEAQGIAYEHLKLVPVPPSVVETHKKILSTMRLSMDAMSTLSSVMTVPDSAKGLDAISKFQIALSSWNDLGDTLQNLVIEYQVTLPI